MLKPRLEERPNTCLISASVESFGSNVEDVFKLDCSTSKACESSSMRPTICEVMCLDRELAPSPAAILCAIHHVIILAANDGMACWVFSTRGKYSRLDKKNLDSMKKFSTGCQNSTRRNNSQLGKNILDSR